MDKSLFNVYLHMLELGKTSISLANWHSCFDNSESPMWSEMSVLQAAHAAEIFIKARICQEHPLLIFEKIPSVNFESDEVLDLKSLIEKGRTYQYSDLPNRLWASTGIKLENLDGYNAFGKLRNCIQHFASPEGVSCRMETVRFIYEVIDPFIYKCWGLCAIDYTDESDTYYSIPENLIDNCIAFNVSKQAALELCRMSINWPEDSSYTKKMLSRIELALSN